MRKVPQLRNLFWVVFLAAVFLFPHAPRGAGAATTPAANREEAWWAKRHDAVLELVRAHPETRLLMIGDSITQDYESTTPESQNFHPIWQEFYAPRLALNLGFSGDSTANLLWRLSHGEVEGLHPKVAVLLIGTNNTDHFAQSGEQAAAGIDAVVKGLEDRLPATRILLLGILPSGVSAAKSSEDAAVNRYLAHRYVGSRRVTYLDVGDIFRRDGRLDATLFLEPVIPGRLSGSLHPNTTGQRMLAEAIDPTLTRMLAAP